MLTSKQKSDWVAALRSGEFEQGVSHLEHEGKFCCLGVLAKINGLPTDEAQLCMIDHEEINLHQASGKFTALGKLIDMGMPPHPMSHGTTLAELNDWGIPFISIANHIAEHLPTKD